MVGDNWRHLGDVLVKDSMALQPELFDSGLHIDRVPMGDDVEHEAESPELFFLSLTQWLAYFAPVTVTKAPTKRMPRFLAVQLYQDSPAKLRVAGVTQDMDRFGCAPDLGQRLSHGRRPIFDLQEAHDAARLKVSKFEGSTQTNKVLPLGLRAFKVKVAKVQFIERRVVGFCAQTPEFSAAQVGQSYLMRPPHLP